MLLLLFIVRGVFVMTELSCLLFEVQIKHPLFHELFMSFNDLQISHNKSSLQLRNSWLLLRQENTRFQHFSRGFCGDSISRMYAHARIIYRICRNKRPPRNKHPPKTFDISVIFQRGGGREYTKPMGFDGWFFKGRSTQNRWLLECFFIFSKD